MNDNKSSNHNLQAVARQLMQEEGFRPDFSPQVIQQLADLKVHAPQVATSKDIRDLRGLLWSSIDNDTSRDLDQIEVAERLPNGDMKVKIGIADVDAYVSKGTPIDEHAAQQTTSIYAGVRIFPMLPEDLSTGATSLLEDGDKLAVVTEFLVSKDGSVSDGIVYRALVHNKAQLTYNAVGAWLEGNGGAPPKVSVSNELQDQLKLQDEAAQALRKQRYENGALNLETAELRPVLRNQEVVGIEDDHKNHATELIEDFMIAANGVVARMLEKVSSLRRIVRTPKRWDGIMHLAAVHGDTLPATPDSKALNEFLLKRHAADPDHFADLSLAVIKLMGPGEYVLERPGDPETGHFGLAVQDYTHSTAPNRRFPDLVTQRLIKAMLAGKPNPYTDSELGQIAASCTERENAANKVERGMAKRLAAVAMGNRIGQVFDAVVTGVTPRGTFVRVFKPHVEGLLAQGDQGLDVGDRIRAKLIRTDVDRGYIDFARA